jgi:hypothetical protein
VVPVWPRPKPTMKSPLKQFRRRGGGTGNLISTRTVQKAEAGDRKSGSKSSSKESKGGRKNPRLLSNLLAQGPGFCETYCESIPPEEVLKLFEESYCSSMVNFLLDVKKSTAKRIFETVVRLKKRTFINVLTLYHYKDYLTNPLPLTVEAESGRPMPNHYAIVGMPREATIEELKVAHKLLVSSFATESFPPSERKAGEERLREIEESFEILKNPKRRKEIDEALPNINYLYPRRDQSWFEAVNRLVS